MFLRVVLLFLGIVKICGEIIHYDTFTGLPISDEEYEQHVKANNVNSNKKKIIKSAPSDTCTALDVQHDEKDMYFALIKPAKNQISDTIDFSIVIDLQRYNAARQITAKLLLICSNWSTDSAIVASIVIKRMLWCVLDVETCDPDEWRRVGGSCNNLNYPTRGAIHTPNYRILPPAYDEVNEPRKAKDGSTLPLSRVLRTRLLAEGNVPDQVFTQLTTLFISLVVSDTTHVHDTVNYVIYRPYCCQAKGKTDPHCIPNKVPDDDPVHRFSSVRCLNLTRPESFQSVGCTRNDTAPDRIVTSTPMFDISGVYGNTEQALSKLGRKFKGGLLKYDEVDGRIWPPSIEGEHTFCILNQKPAETRCHNTPDVGANAMIGIIFLVTWFWRHHNHVANALAEINPCWDDDKLFYTARDINIAVFSQILYYEAFSVLMGKENLIRDGVLSPFLGFRDVYDDKIIPQISLEFPFAMRWFHIMQEGFINMYDEDGNYLKRFPTVNLTLRTGFLAVDNNFDYMTQGAFRQASGKIDYVVDPEVAEVGLGGLQYALDICTNDMSKNRYFGFQPYVKYKEFFFNKPYKCFEDLLDDIDPERVEILKALYKNVEDIDLLSGLWLEKPMGTGYLPPTLYSLLKDQLIRTVKSDRHWYERQNRPHAFTFEQLLEIRKVTVSRFLCDVGDKVTRIQPKGFLKIGPGNRLRDCKELPKINYEAWRDTACYFNK